MDNTGDTLMQLAAVGVALYFAKMMYDGFRHNIIKQCPSCKEKGVLEKIDEKLRNKRRQSSRISRSERGRTRNVTVYKTTEYWDYTYQCTACGHSFVHKGTTSYSS